MEGTRCVSQMVFSLVTLCDIRITREHTEQISKVTGKSNSEESCRTSAQKWTTAVYCPDDGFCGQDIDPGKTGELKFIDEKVCHVFLDDMESCDALQARLDEAGK